MAGGVPLTPTGSRASVRPRIASPPWDTSAVNPQHAACSTRCKQRWECLAERVSGSQCISATGTELLAVHAYWVVGTAMEASLPQMLCLAC